VDEGCIGVQHLLGGAASGAQEGRPFGGAAGETLQSVVSFSRLSIAVVTAAWSNKQEFAVLDGFFRQENGDRVASLGALRLLALPGGGSRQGLLRYLPARRGYAWRFTARVKGREHRAGIEAWTAWSHKESMV
jgi:hypothetical protein